VCEALTAEVSKGQSTWTTMKEIMTVKCATAQAHRKVFPDLLGGLYSADEMPELQRNIDEDYADTGTAKVEKRDERTGAEDAKTLDDAKASLHNEYIKAVMRASPTMLDVTIKRMFPDLLSYINSDWEKNKPTVNLCEEAENFIVEHGIPLEVLSKYDLSKKDEANDKAQAKSEGKDQKESLFT
jgi:hypothetical protein